MAENEQEESKSGIDRLREELTGYLGARAQDLVKNLGGNISGLTEKLTDSAEGGGALPGAGMRILKGESPAKAMIAEKAKDVKDKVTGKVKDAVGGGQGGGAGKPGDTKVTNIVEVLDIGVPLRTVYNQWTMFEEFGSYMKGVRNVSRKDDEPESDWKVKVGPSTRGWKATVQEQVPDDRIVWTSEGSKASTQGAVSFHEVGPNLTRIVVVVEYYPSGFFEKTGNLWRAQGRRLRLDLKHFQRYVTLTEDEAEGWRGEIREGEIVRSHEEVVQEEEKQEEEGTEEEGTEGTEGEESAEDESTGEDEEEGAENGENGEEEDEAEDSEEQPEEKEAEEQPEEGGKKNGKKAKQRRRT